ncbi:hypothetical protein ACW6QP_12270 [Salegentibacter sp. HM20]
MKKTLLVLIFLAVGYNATAQDLNQYKYVVVPNSFEFSKEENQYQLNALAKFLFEKYGFETLMNNESKPTDLQRDNCLAMYADVKDESGLFVTKMTLILKDCYGKTIFTSKEGRSREKDFEPAWHEALRDAFTSLEEVDYQYIPSQEEVAEVEVTAGPKRAAAEPDTVEVSAAPPKRDKSNEAVVSEASQTDREMTETSGNQEKGLYSYNNSSYELRANEKGFAFFQRNASEPFAMLIRSAEGNTYIYNSLTRQGVAWFDEAGNLNIEFFNPDTNSTETLEYKLQN